MKAAPFRITPVYDILLRGSDTFPVGLYHLHLVTAAQLTRLHYQPGTLKTVKKRLKVLADNGYVQADSLPSRQCKSPYFYTLGAKGIRYLADTGLDIPVSFRQGKEVDQHYLFIQHSLELNDVLIAALRLKFADPRYYLARYIHERMLRSTPYKVNMNGHQVSLIPDGFLDFHVRRPDLPDLSLPLILEHDRGTEQQEHFRRRIRAYKAFLSAGAFKQLVGTERITVVFTTFLSGERVAQMREWTKAELATEPQLAGMFIFAELPKPLEAKHLLFERRWYTLASDEPIALLGE